MNNYPASAYLYLRMIGEIEDYAMILLDVNGLVVDWNKGAAHIKGYRAEEVIGRSFEIFYTDGDREAGLPGRLLEEARTVGKVVQEGWRVRKNGSLFWASVVITALHNDDGHLIGFGKVTRNLTAQKAAAETLQAYTAELEQKNRQLADYAHVTSHDLQEPLRKIGMFASMIRGINGVDMAVEPYLAKIENAAARMSKLIKDILAYAQLTNVQTQAFEPIELDRLLTDVIDDYSLAIAEKRAQITVNALPVVKGIPVQLRQLFANLLGNALKFSNNEPRIKIYPRIAGPGEMNVDQSKFHEIIFEDNGIGFDAVYADQVFQLFKKLHSDKPGTGIGLAICKTVVENHGGTIEVTSNPGKGTCFSILLPKLE